MAHSPSHMLLAGVQRDCLQSPPSPIVPVCPTNVRAGGHHSGLGEHLPTVWCDIPACDGPTPRGIQGPRDPGSRVREGFTPHGLGYGVPASASLHPCSGTWQHSRNCSTVTQEPLAQAQRCSFRTSWTRPLAAMGPEWGRGGSATRPTPRCSCPG